MPHQWPSTYPSFKRCLVQDCSSRRNIQQVNCASKLRYEQPLPEIDLKVLAFQHALGHLYYSSILPSNEKLEQGTPGYERVTFRGRGHGRGRSQYKRTNSRGGVQCHHCRRFRHIEANCWSKNNCASYSEKEEEESTLFL